MNIYGFQNDAETIGRYPDKKHGLGIDFISGLMNMLSRRILIFEGVEFVLRVVSCEWKYGSVNKTNSIYTNVTTSNIMKIINKYILEREKKTTI